MISVEDVEYVRNTVIPLLEEKYTVKIIFLVESGSRMWGFPSADSDLDCRGVFVPKIDALLGTKPPLSIISYTTEKNGRTHVDLNIWSIQKFGKHLQESNPSIFEWLQSEIVYQCNEESMAFAKSCLNSFDRTALRKHYVSMAIGNYKQNIATKKKMSAKKYLYVLRALACVACLDAGDLPHVSYEKVIGYLPENLQIKMQFYVAAKKEVETMEVAFDTQVKDYMATFVASNAKVSSCKDLILEEEINHAVIRIMNLNLNE